MLWELTLIQLFGIEPVLGLARFLVSPLGIATALFALALLVWTLDRSGEGSGGRPRPHAP